MSTTHEKVSSEPADVQDVLPPADPLEELQPLKPRDQCELFDYFVETIDEFAELADEDLLFLEDHLANCPTGRHSDLACAEALGLPQEALRQGSLEHGLQFPQRLFELNLSILEIWQQSEVALSGRPERLSAADKDTLFDRQKTAASQHPGEYVVLQGDKCLYHSKSRREAFKAYDQVCVEAGGFYPVLVVPGHQDPETPHVFRGRSLTK